MPDRRTGGRSITSTVAAVFGVVGVTTTLPVGGRVQAVLRLYLGQLRRTSSSSATIPTPKAISGPGLLEGTASRT